MSAARIGIILASHAELAASMVRTVELIVEGRTDFFTFAFAEREDPQRASRRLQDLVRKADNGRGVLILVDLFGGTPGSLAMSLVEPARVDVVTGVNLPMAIAAATLDPALDLHGAAEAVVNAGQQSIQQAGAMLKS
ncbi:MAG: PTS sugar transporter subunit IIA [Candidatus Lambdaproteobacteria bacterium]|nr:PTS sugar transporter subunit IIA [Candidatus Lambdaproteobacteria bacterium]